MSFCTQCGMKLQQDEVHNCSNPKRAVEVPAVATASATAIPASTHAATTAPSLQKVDHRQLVNLLRNPMSALQLRGENDLLYGLIGIAVSIIGFMLWAWSFKHQLIQAMVGQLSTLLGGSKYYDERYSAASDSLSIVTHSLLLSVVSLIVLLATVFLIGNKLGTQRFQWKDALVKLGGLQLVSGAIFIVAALLMFVSMSISVALLATVATASLCLTIYAAIEMFRLSREREVWFIGLVVLIQTVAVLLVFRSFGSEMMSGLRDLF